MTEKRFWYDFEDCNGTKIVDFKEDKEYPLETIGDFRKIEDLLNAQHEEIQSLKSEIKISDECETLSIENSLRLSDKIVKLKKENEQLKQSYSDLETSMDICRNARDVYSERIVELEKENEQLKQQNKNLFEKLKFTVEQVNYSENLRKILDGDIE